LAVETDLGPHSGNWM